MIPSVSFFPQYPLLDRTKAMIKETTKNDGPRTINAIFHPSSFSGSFLSSFELSSFGSISSSSSGFTYSTLNEANVKLEIDMFEES